MGEYFYDLFSMLWDFLIIMFVIIALMFLLQYIIKDAQLQHTQHQLTREVNVASSTAGKDGMGGTLDYGEPYSVSGNKTFNFLGKDIKLKESRTGVNRGKFTLEGYVYR